MAIYNPVFASKVLCDAEGGAPSTRMHVKQARLRHAGLFYQTSHFPTAQRVHARLQIVPGFIIINSTLSDYAQNRHTPPGSEYPAMASSSPSMAPGFASQSSAPAIHAGMTILEHSDYVI